MRCEMSVLRTRRREVAEDFFDLLKREREASDILFFCLLVEG